MHIFSMAYSVRAEGCEPDSIMRFEPTPFSPGNLDFEPAT